MTHNPPPVFATFRCPDEETAKLYAHARDVKIDLESFAEWMRSTAKHGGLSIDGESAYDQSTMQRAYEMLYEYMGEHLS